MHNIMTKPEIELFLKGNNCDIFCRSEHWCNSAYITSINIEGYNKVSCFCRVNMSHGSVCILSRVDVNYWYQVAQLF